MLKLNDFISQVHDNAVDKGWWDRERTFGEAIALLHSELSESLEEYRAGRPEVWFPCNEAGKHDPCIPRDEWDCRNYGHEKECIYRGKKPEGIYIELIDVVIRIFDWFGANGISLCEPDTVDSMIDIVTDKFKEVLKDASFTDVIAFLHMTVTEAYKAGEDSRFHSFHMFACVSAIFYYLRSHGADPEELLVMKHEFNKTRPYRHGNKVC